MRKLNDTIKEKMTKDSNQERGKRIKEVRTTADLTQAEFCKRIGMTIANYNRAENGLSKMREGTLRKIAKEFNVSFDWLSTGKGLKNTDTTEYKLLTDLTPVYIIEKTALITISNNLKQTTQMQETILIPNLGEGNHYAVRIDSRNMEPKLPQGSILIVTEIEENRFLPNRIYYLIIEGVPILRTVELVLSGENTGKLRLSEEATDREEIIDRSQVQRWFMANHFVSKI